MTDARLSPLTATDLERIIRETTALVSLPAVCVKINEMIERNNYSAAEIGNLISRDTNLTARLLRVANSAFYGFPAKISTVSRAITIIGSRELRDLVLATSAIEAFNKIPIEAANMNSFWTHSLDCAIIARLIAARCSMLHGESVFVAGLLHDVGHLMLYLKAPELAHQALLLAARKNVDIEHAEREVVGFDHAHVGAELLRAWNIPDTLVAPVRYHHNPFAAEAHQREAVVVYTANLLAKISRAGSGRSAAIRVDPRAWEILNIEASEADAIVNEARMQFAEALSIFLPHLAQA
jgi:putative nucleotidyltransferase with HDIG domain